MKTINNIEWSDSVIETYVKNGLQDRTTKMNRIRSWQDKALYQSASCADAMPMARCEALPEEIESTCPKPQPYRRHVGRWVTGIVAFIAIVIVGIIYWPDNNSTLVPPHRTAYVNNYESFLSSNEMEEEYMALDEESIQRLIDLSQQPVFGMAHSTTVSDFETTSTTANECYDTLSESTPAIWETYWTKATQLLDDGEEQEACIYLIWLSQYENPYTHQADSILHKINEKILTP